MDDGEKDKAGTPQVVTPFVAPHDGAEAGEATRNVDTDAPVSTDREGDPVDLPDLGGRID